MSELVKIYDLSLDSREIEQVQQATLNTKDYGLKPIPALFGSPEWWKSIESGGKRSRGNLIVYFESQPFENTA